MERRVSLEVRNNRHVVFSLGEVRLIGLRQFEYLLNIIVLLHFNEQMQDCVSTWEYVVEHRLHILLVDLVKIDQSIADLVSQVPMQECETQIGVLHPSGVHSEQFIVEGYLILLVEKIVLGLVSLVLSQQLLFSLIDV
jgi:hypothetical protein